jgi:hypothetical protein
VLPYWGPAADRKALRRTFAQQRRLFGRAAPFHVAVTSYQVGCCVLCACCGVREGSLRRHQIAQQTL